MRAGTADFPLRNTRDKRNTHTIPEVFCPRGLRYNVDVYTAFRNIIPEVFRLLGAFSAVFVLQQERTKHLARDHARSDRSRDLHSRAFGSVLNFSSLSIYSRWQTSEKSRREAARDGSEMHDYIRGRPSVAINGRRSSGAPKRKGRTTTDRSISSIHRDSFESLRETHTCSRAILPGSKVRFYQWSRLK